MYPFRRGVGSTLRPGQPETVPLQDPLLRWVTDRTGIGSRRPGSRGQALFPDPEDRLVRKARGDAAAVAEAAQPVAPLQGLDLGGLLARVASQLLGVVGGVEAAVAGCQVREL